MNEFMLNKYIDKLTVTHIKEYAKNQGIILKNNEDEIIYDFIKNNYMKLYKEAKEKIK